MVLQREMPIRLRGWADPGERVTVEFGDTQAETLATQQGTWEVTLPEQRANTVGQNLVFQSTNRIVLDDVLVGDWPAIQLCVRAFQIDDITKRHNAIGNLVTPMHQSPNGKR